MNTIKEGASDGGESANIKDETEKTIVDGGEKEIDTNVDDKSKAELEELKKATAGKDKKIAELLAEQNVLKKAQEEKELAGKSAKEQNELYKKKVEEYERKESFRKAFKESGLVADEWEFIDSGDHLDKANKIVEIFNREKEAYANKKLEAFKLSELGKVNKNVPDIKDNKQIDESKDIHLEMAKKLKNS